MARWAVTESRTVEVEADDEAGAQLTANELLFVNDVDSVSVTVELVVP